MQLCRFAQRFCPLKRLALPFCAFAVACTPPTPDGPTKISTTYRILSGVSMGATGAAALGFRTPEKFDGIAMLGGPLDSAYFSMRMVDEFALSGFCSRAQLEAIAALDPSKLNDPDEIARCVTHTPTQKWEHAQDFNHWHYSTSGNSTTRDVYLNMFTDISLAYGNLLTQNPDSPFAPPGVPAEWARVPPGDACLNPVRVPHFYNAEYNPDGKYDAITFCDGQPRLYFCRNTQRPVDFCSDPANKRTPLPPELEAPFAQKFCELEGGPVEANADMHPLYMYAHAGAVDPCRRATRPVRFALALDINGNGRRDYGEPVIQNAHERFDDVGADGCPDEREDGAGGCLPTATASAVDPNHDNYDPSALPLGTEHNFSRDEGEPFRDDGLDGVPGTADTGEGNGQFDLTSGRQKLFAHDGRTNLKKMSPAARARLNVLVDGGVRDVFNLGVMSNHFFGLLKSLTTEAGAAVGEYRDFLEIPNMKNRNGVFDPWGAGKWRTVPRDLLLLYGKDTPSDDDLISGEGDHVGTIQQALDRFNVMFNWAAASWPSLSRPATPFGSPLVDRQHTESFDSTVLGAPWEYSVVVPAGYDDPANADARYPVVYMLHGYGMDPKAFMTTALITDAVVTDTDIKFRPMIMVFVNGRCCHINYSTGQRDCRETGPDGKDLQFPPEFVRECISGNFFVNRSGYSFGDGTRYGDALYELMDHIDASYRTLKPTEVDAR